MVTKQVIKVVHVAETSIASDIEDKIQLEFSIGLGLDSSDVMGRQDYRALSDMLGVDFEGTNGDGVIIVTCKKNLYRIKKEPPSNL